MWNQVPFIVFLTLALLFATSTGFAMLMYVKLLDERNRRLYELNKLNPYKQKGYFLTVPEKRLFGILNAMDTLKDYYIFPQVSASALIQVKEDADDMEGKFDWVNKYCVDFLICDKYFVLPRLVIELNDSTHKFSRRKARDQFLETSLKGIGIKILFLDTLNSTAQIQEFIKDVLSLNIVLNLKSTECSSK